MVLEDVKNFLLGLKMVGRWKKSKRVKHWLYFVKTFLLLLSRSVNCICGQPLVTPTPRYRLYGQGHTAGDFGGQSPKSGRPKVIQ